MKDLIYDHAIRNASVHGKANSKAVLSKVLGERPHLRKNAREILLVVEEIVEKVNSLEKDKIKREAELLNPIKVKIKEKGLGELPNAKPNNVRLRFAPNPSGPLHLGHARAALLNDEYSKKYKGKLILRFEDTDPKRVDLQAYEMIRNDLDWLDVKIDDEIIQSDRLDLYYKRAKELFQKDAVYLCTCKSEVFRGLREIGKACSCRQTKNKLENFDSLFNDYKEGEAVLRLKTDMNHSNRSFRDYPIMRIVNTPHPLQGKADVYPLMNFSVAVDDHELGLTHVLRGKDHILNTQKQKFIFDYFGWEPPVYIHYGLLKIEEVNLSTSQISEGIKSGEYTGWDDIRLGTISAIARRGIRKEVIRRSMLDVGIKQTDISFSWKNLYAANKELVDPISKRYSFVENPKKFRVLNAPAITASNRLHPTRDMGVRETRLGKDDQIFFVSEQDHKNLKDGLFVRLMGAYNVEIKILNNELVGMYHSKDLREGKKKRAILINWVIPEKSIKINILHMDRLVKGYGEEGIGSAEIGDILQFERYGFITIDKKEKDGITAIFSHH